MHAMVLTRPDFSYAVNVVSRYMAKPGKEHWKAVIWILRYLSGTIDNGFLNGNVAEEDANVIGYADPNYTSDLDKRRSLTVYLLLLNNCTINWKATLQKWYCFVNNRSIIYCSCRCYKRSKMI